MSQHAVAHCVVPFSGRAWGAAKGVLTARHDLASADAAASGGLLVRRAQSQTHRIGENLRLQSLRGVRAERPQPFVIHRLVPELLKTPRVMALSICIKLLAKSGSFLGIDVRCDCPL